MPRRVSRSSIAAMRRASTALAPAPIFIPRAPAAAPIVRRGGSSSARIAAIRAKAATALAHARSRARAHLGAHKAKYIPIAVGLGLGLMRRFLPGVMESLTFGPVGPELAVGAAALIASLTVAKNNPIIDNLAVAALTVAAYKFGESGFATEGEPASY